MLTGYGDPSHGCLRAFGKTGQEKLTGRRRVYATSTDNANTRRGLGIPPLPGGLGIPRHASVVPVAAVPAPVPLPRRRAAG